MQSRAMSSSSLTAELLETLGDFTSKENWDKFFTIRGSKDAFEWYAEWTAIRGPLLSHLQSFSDQTTASNQKEKQLPDSQLLQVLVPGCGSSRLSEHLYDAGYHGITNIDFSKVVISNMLRSNIRLRPEMKWRVMDMTDMQFAGELFDAVIDKGGLDALMEPKHGRKLGRKYLKEVKRVLKTGGEFLCLTLAESHVVGLLFSEFRFGWKTSIHAIPQEHNKKNGFQTFMVVIIKDNLSMLNPISSSLDDVSKDVRLDQGVPLSLAIKTENEVRQGISTGADILYSLDDLQLGAKGDLKKILPQRRCQIVLGEDGDSRFSYRAILLDSPEKSDAFSYLCGVFIVPKARADEWLFASEEGQWLVVDSSKAARLIMVFLDSRHSHAVMDDIQKDLSPLVKPLLPENSGDEATIPFLTAGDGVKQRNLVKKVTSPMTGPILVEDVEYENNQNSNNTKSAEPIIFRRLTFERSPGLVQSEGLLIREHSGDNFGRTERKICSTSCKHGKKQSQSRKTFYSGSKMKLDHSYLASSYHSGILSGFFLISSSLRNAAASGQMVKTIIIGLGAGLFPMCLHKCLPFLDIEVVELDPVVFQVARDCFEFKEDGQLKVYISDGVKFIQDKNTIGSSAISTGSGKYEPSQEYAQMSSITYSHLDNGAEDTRDKILIVDADSFDISSGLTCPPADFLEESFLLSVKNFLSGGGLFIINLVSRSTATREAVILKMKKVFRHLFYLELEEDVNDVIFAIPGESCVDLHQNFQEMVAELERLLVFDEVEKKGDILDIAKKIKYLN